MKHKIDFSLLTVMMLISLACNLSVTDSGDNQPAMPVETQVALTVAAGQNSARQVETMVAFTLTAQQPTQPIRLHLLDQPLQLCRQLPQAPRQI